MPYVKNDDNLLICKSGSKISLENIISQLIDFRIIKHPSIDITVQDKDIVYKGTDDKYYPALADGTEKENVVGIYDAENDRIITCGIVKLNQILEYGKRIYLSDQYPGKIQLSPSHILIGISIGDKNIILNPYIYETNKANENLSNVDDSTILNKLKNVDGAGSGLDADKLDGHDSTYFANKNLSNVTNDTILAKLKNVDGSGSGLDADLLDGHDSSYFAKKDLTNVDDDIILSKLKNVDGSGSGLDADKLDGHDSTYFAKEDLTNVDDDIILSKLKNVDGSGSGLDADKLDGHDSSYFAKKDLTNINSDIILNMIKEIDGAGSGLDADLLDGIDGSQFVRSDVDDILYGNYTLQNNKGILWYGNTDHAKIRFESVDDSSSNLVFRTGDNGDEGWKFIAEEGTEEHEILYMNRDNFKYKNHTIWHSGNDGSGSGLDADLLDGKEASYFAINDLSNIDDDIILSKLKNVDGSGSGLDADLLDGRDSTSFANKDLSNVNNNIILEKLKNVDGPGSGLNADLLDGINSSQFVRSDVDDTLNGNYVINGSLSVNDNVIISGNLTVSGTTTHVNTEILDVADNIVLLNSNVTGTPTEDAGIEIQRGTENNVKLFWNEAADDWYVSFNDNDIYKIWHSGNDGFGSGLDADLLDGKEASYFAINDLSNIDDDIILSKLKNVDGSGSGLDADLLDGHDSSYFAKKDLTNVNNSVILFKLRNVDGSGSELDADLLDGQHGSFYRNASNLNAGTVPVARLSGTYNINISGNAATATNADKLDGHDSSYFAKKDLTNVTNNTILAKLKNVDGSGSGLDADKLDGIDSSQFVRSDVDDILYGNYTLQNNKGILWYGNTDHAKIRFESVDDFSSNLVFRTGDNGNEGWKFIAEEGTEEHEILYMNRDNFKYKNHTIWHSGNDGSGSGLDADLLDGQHGSFYRNASNLNAGTVPTARLSGTYNISISGNAATATNANKLDGQHGDFYRNASNLNAGTVPTARLSGTYNISISGNAATATNADKLDGQHGSFYRNASNLNAGTVPTARLSGTYNISISGNAATATNADKLDGKHAVQFVEREADGGAINISNTDLNNLIDTGFYNGSNLANNPENDTNWWYVIVIRHSNENGYTLQIATSLNGSGKTYYRRQINGSWEPWNEYWHSGSDGPGSGLNADKLDGHDSSYFANKDLTNVTNNTILNKLKNVDGAGSGLDADLLDGQHGSFYRNASNLNAGTVPTARLSGTYNISISGNAATATNADKLDGHDSTYFATNNLSNIDDDVILDKLKNVDGAGSGLDADLLDGQHGSFYRNASNLNAGTVPTARLSGTYNISISGNAATATNADKLDGQHGSFYRNASNLNAGTVPTARLSGTYNINISGNAATATNADKLDNLDSSHFLRSDVNDTYSAEILTFSHNNVILKFDSGVNYGKQISCNDGSGNFVFKSNYNGSFKYIRSNDGAAGIQIDTENTDGQIKLRVASVGTAGNTVSFTDVILKGDGTFTYAGNKIWHSGNDGSGSGLDADLLDGQHGSFYRNASNLNAGTIPTARLSGIYNISISGNAATATNADKLDGKHANEFALTGHNHDSRYVKLTDYEDSDVLTKIKNVDGAGSGLDADLLDGQHGSFYRNASNLNAGTVPTTRLSGTYNINISGNAATATNADKLDGHDSSYFANKDLTNVNDSTILNKLKNVDGAGSGLDADLLDGRSSEGYVTNPMNLPLSRIGDSSFLDLPIYADFEGSAYPFRNRDYLFNGSDGRVYIYSVRTNYFKQRVYIGYTDKDVSNTTLSSFEYRPPFLLESEYIDWIVDGNEYGMLVRIRDENDSSIIKYYWVHFNNTENPSGHTYTDVTNISSGSYFSVVYCKEFNVWIKGYYTNRKFIYEIYDSTLNIKLSQEGIDFTNTSTEVSFPSGYGGLSIYHTGYTQLNYKINGNEIHLKNFIGIRYYIGNHEYIRTLKDYVEFNINSNSSTKILPPNLPINIHTSDENYVSSINLYFNRYKPYKISDNYTYVTITKADDSCSRRILRYNESYETAFDNDFHFFKSPIINKTIYPLDNSLIGKNVYEAALVRLKKNNIPKDFVIVIGKGVDPNTHQIKTNYAIVEGVDVNNLSNYSPTKINKISCLPHIIYLKQNVTHNILYKISSNDTIHEYSSYEDLLNNTPNTIQIPNLDTYAHNILNEFTQQFSNVKNSYYTHYWIPNSNYAIVCVGCVYEGNTTDTLSGRGAFCTINTSNGSRISDFIYIYEVNNSSSLKTSLGLVDRFLGCYEDSSNGYYYTVFNCIDFYFPGGDLSKITKAKINKSSGLVESYSTPTTNHNWQHRHSTVHPEIGFAISISFDDQNLASRLHGDPSPSSIIDSWNYGFSSDLGVFVTIKSAIGLNITFDEFEIILNGQQTKVPLTFIDNLNPNTTYYTYVIYDSNTSKGKIELKTTYESPDNSKVYIGWFRTDNISIAESSFNKPFVLQTMFFDSNGNLIPMNTINLGSSSNKFGTIYANSFNGLATNADKWDGGDKYISHADPSGGSDGDVWFKY